MGAEKISRRTADADTMQTQDVSLIRNHVLLLFILDKKVQMGSRKIKCNKYIFSEEHVNNINFEPSEQRN